MFKKFLLILILGFFSFSQTILYASSKIIPLKVGFSESFDLTSSTASERYKNAYLSSIYYAIGENEKRLNRCGYQLQVITNFFSNNNLISAKNSAAELEQKDAWIILGPVRSDQFIMSTRGAPNTPIVSLMAESNNVMNLKPPHFTASPGVLVFVKRISDILDKEKIGKTYGTLIDASCSECKDFEKEFTQINNKKFNKLFSVDAYGERPLLDELFDKLKINKIDFLLLPNYSKFSGYVISQVHTKYPNIKFVGFDGWGQTYWSFLPGYGLSADTNAISVRVGLSDDKMEKKYDVHSLNVSWKDTLLKPPYVAYGTIEILRKITEDLCKWKPDSKVKYHDLLSSVDKKHFRTKTPVSLYKLKNGMLEFSAVTND